VSRWETKNERKQAQVTNHSLVRGNDVADPASSVQVGEVPGAGTSTAVNYESVGGAADGDVRGAAGEGNGAKIGWVSHWVLMEARWKYIPDRCAGTWGAVVVGVGLGDENTFSLELDHGKANTFGYNAPYSVIPEIVLLNGNIRHLKYRRQNGGIPTPHR
jgi:hypothetical protein